MHDRLQKFARLVEVGSFTKAARELHISQPALSIAIDKLEQELGMELLVRGNRRIDVTAAGREVYRAALQHQNTTDHLHSALNHLSGKKPEITLGMTDSIAATLCLTPSFEKLDKAAELTIVVNNSRFLREAVIERDIDVAFTIDDGAEHAGLDSQVYKSEQLLLVASPKLADKLQAGLSQGKLPGFISYDKPSTTYRHVNRFLAQLNIRPQITLYSTSPDVMLQMVIHGKGTAALPEYLVRTHINNGKLTIVKHCDKPVVITRPTCIVKLSGRVFPECLNEFLATSAK